MKTSVLFPLIITLGLIFWSSSPAFTQPLAIVHGTVIDVTDSGDSEKDILDGAVVIQDGRVTAVGETGTVIIPSDCKLIDARGKYILPGLIDGFGSVKNRSFANAYLYMGVTSVIGVEDGRRGRQGKVSAPCPYVFKWRWIPPPGTVYLSESDLLSALEGMKKDRIEVLQLMYPLKPEQVEIAIRYCLGNRIATIAELGHTPYRRAIASGADAIVHTQRYLLDLAPEPMRGKVADDPFGPIMKKYNNWVRQLDLGKRPFREYARFLAQSSVGLIPTISLYGYFLPGSENPWKDPVTANIDPKDIHQPVDPSTGKPPDITPQAETQRRIVANRFLEVERAFFRAGVKYLAGSGTDAFGTMPGISLHREIELLTQVGLTNRQAIAAATGNFSKTFRWPDLGAIKPGCRADILVLDDNPLVDIQNLKKIYLLLLQGKVIDRKKLLTR